MHEAMATEATRLDRRLRARDLDALPHEWDTRYELVGGVLFMSTRPSIEHQRTMARLIVALHPPVTAVSGIVVPEPGLVWEEDGDDSVAPDIAVILADRLGIVDTKLRGAPNIVVEVLSPGSEAHRRDHEAKRDLYFRRGVLEYWTIDPEARTMIRLTRGERDWIEEQLDEAATVRTPLLSHWKGAAVTCSPPRPNES